MFDISEEGISSFSLLRKDESSIPTDCQIEENANRNTINQTDDELKMISDPVDDLVLTLGKELINEIQAEENFPPDYLKNVIEKVASIKVRYDTAKDKVHKARMEMDYADYHRNFEQQLQILTTILQDCEIWLEDFTGRMQLDLVSKNPMAMDKGKP